MRLYTLEDLAKPSTYENDPQLAALVRRAIAPRHHRELGMGIGECKRRMLAGEYPELVAMEVALIYNQEREAAKASTQGAKEAQSIDLPSGYALSTEGDMLVLAGEFDADLHQRIKRAGGQWDGKSGANRRVWLVPAAKGGSLKRIIQNWRKSLESRVDEAPRKEAEKWLSYAEDDVLRGLTHTNAISQAPALAAPFGHLAGRLDALKSRLDELNAQYDMARRTQEETPRAKTGAATAMRHPRTLYPLSMLPQLGNPVRLGNRVVVYEEYGKRFFISEDHPSVAGSHLLGHEGESGCYAYYREATEEEISALEAEEQAMALQPKVVQYKKAELSAIREQVIATGEYPDGRFILQGEVLHDTQDSYGGGDWFVITPDYIWYVRNNGMDGDDWSHNNISTGGAGAIGYRVPYNAALAKRLHALEGNRHETE